MLLESAKETQQNGMQKVFVKKQNSKHRAVTAVSRNQPAGWQVATFVVRSRLRFAKIFIFNRKYKVPKFATDAKRNVVQQCRKRIKRENNINNNEKIFY